MSARVNAYDGVGQNPYGVQPPPAYQPPSVWSYNQPNSFGFDAQPSRSSEPQGSSAQPSYGAQLSHSTLLVYDAQPGHGGGAAVSSVTNNQNLKFNFVAVQAPAVVITQLPSASRPPPNYLIWSIFNFLCWFWPLGLAAIIYSVKVGSARSYQEARSYSITARNLNISATVLAPVLAVILVGSVLGGSNYVTARSSSYNSYNYPSYSSSSNSYPSSSSTTRSLYYYAIRTSYSSLTSYTYSFYSYNAYYRNYGISYNTAYRYATAYRYTQGVI